MQFLVVTPINFERAYFTKIHQVTCMRGNWKQVCNFGMRPVTFVDATMVIYSSHTRSQGEIGGVRVQNTRNYLKAYTPAAQEPHRNTTYRGLQRLRPTRPRRVWRGQLGETKFGGIPRVPVAHSLFPQTQHVWFTYHVTNMIKSTCPWRFTSGNTTHRTIGRGITHLLWSEDGITFIIISRPIPALQNL